jgi:hypothetical protein
LGPENKMPATNLVCAPYRLVISTCYGELTAPELKSATVDLRRHPEFHPGFRQLIDLSHVVKLNLDFRDLYQLKHSDDPFSNEGKRAVFAPNDVSFGMSRMYQLILNAAHFEVFRSLADALAWLELDPATLEEVLRNPTQDPSEYLTQQPNRLDS